MKIAHSHLFHHRKNGSDEGREGGQDSKVRMVRHNIGQVMKAQVSDPPKKWEDTNIIEKSIELDMGEKDLLFWLNVFAYASIFIVINWGWEKS